MIKSTKRFFPCFCVLLSLMLLFSACTSSENKPETVNSENTPSNERIDSSDTITVSLMGVNRFSVVAGGLNFDDSCISDGILTVSDGNQSLELRCFESRTNAENAAPSFLNDYIDYMSIEFSGSNQIGQTSVFAETISAENSKTAVEAYLIDVSDGLISAVLIHSAKEPVSGALFAVLESLNIL